MSLSLCLQDYSTFFTAVECEALFRYLDLQPPPEEVEAQLENGIMDLLTPSPEELEHLKQLQLQEEERKKQQKEVRQEVRKLEMLGSIVSHLASPRKILGENFLSTQDGIKHPEMHKKVKVGQFFWRWKKNLDEKKF